MVLRRRCHARQEAPDKTHDTSCSKEANLSIVEHHRAGDKEVLDYLGEEHEKYP